MNILAVDTSSQRLSLALRFGGRTRTQVNLAPSKRHAEVILPEIEALLRREGLQPKDLEGVAVGLGPGSFTGLRVGVAAMQGMAQSLGVPAAGVSSFLAVAEAGEAEIALVIEDARQDSVYAGMYAREGAAWTPLLPESLLTIPELAQRLPARSVALTGPGAEKFLGLLAQAGAAYLILAPEATRFPEAAVIARLAEPLLAAGGVPPETLIPNYLRRTQAEEMRARREGK